MLKITIETDEFKFECSPKPETIIPLLQILRMGLPKILEVLELAVKQESQGPQDKQ